MYDCLYSLTNSEILQSSRHYPEFHVHDLRATSFTASDGTAKILNEKPRIVYRRPRNLKDSLVRARVRMEDIGDKRMRKFGKSRCQICKFVEERRSFEDGRARVLYQFWF